MAFAIYIRSRISVLRRALTPLIYFLILLPGISLGHSSTRTVVFLGDSLTEGYGLAEDSAYPALIQRYLGEEGLPWRTVNAGISGDTTRGGLKRLSWVMRSSPTIVFVALGANDGLRAVDLRHTRKNLESIIVKLKKSGVGVVLAGMDLPVNYGQSYRKKFKALYRKLARKHRVSYYPFLLEGVAMKPRLNLSDGIHPNENGHKVLAKKIYTFLLPLLEKAEGGKGG